VDPARPLSAHGRQDVELIARFLDRAGIRVGQVVHSGKTRAEQTAVVLARTLMPAAEVRARKGPSPKDPVEPIAEWVDGLTVDTLVVGHLPFLERLASLLLAGDTGRVAVAFEPGSVACLERDAGKGWSLVWMIRPELLRAASA